MLNPLMHIAFQVYDILRFDSTVWLFMYLNNQIFKNFEGHSA